MSSKSLCDTCLHRWSSGGKYYCTISQFERCQYSPNKKECHAYKNGKNDKYWRGKDGKNRKGRCW